jgi:hypothetical protein
METVKVASLGQITEALFEVGGQYRRNMWKQIKDILQYCKPSHVHSSPRFQMIEIAINR